MLVMKVSLRSEGSQPPVLGRGVPYYLGMKISEDGI